MAVPSLGRGRCSGPKNWPKRLPETLDTLETSETLESCFPTRLELKVESYCFGCNLPSWQPLTTNKLRFAFIIFNWTDFPLQIHLYLRLRLRPVTYAAYVQPIILGHHQSKCNGSVRLYCAAAASCHCLLTSYGRGDLFGIVGTVLQLCPTPSRRVAPAGCQF